MTRQFFVAASMFVFATVPAMAQSSQGNTGEAFERRFLEMMSHHHQGAIEMANLCQAKAQFRSRENTSDRGKLNGRRVDHHAPMSSRPR